MKYTILAVDDDPINLELVSCCLEEKYTIVKTRSGQECLDVVGEVNPDLILMDVIMPGIDGFTMCQKLKSSDQTAFIPVIFLSALDQAADRLEGYACGAEDYVTKPFDTQELNYKVEMAILRSQQQHTLYQQYQENKSKPNLAEETVEQLFEMGILIKFQQNCCYCKDAEALGKIIVETCHSLGLDVAVQLHNAVDIYYSGCANASFEAQLLQASTQNSQGLSTRNRSVFSGEDISILVKNMPQDDEMKYNRIKDNLNMIIAAATDRIAIINLEERECIKRNSDIQRLESATALLKTHYEDQAVSTKKKVGQLFEFIEESVDTLGLSEDQKVKLLTTIHRCNDTFQSMPLMEHSLVKKNILSSLAH